MFRGQSLLAGYMYMIIAPKSNRRRKGHKPNEAAKRNRARYKAEGRHERNKLRKAKKEEKWQQKLLKKNKGIYAKKKTAEEVNI